MKPSQDQSCQLEVVAALVVLLSQERKCECMSQSNGQNGGRHLSTSDLRTWHIIVGPGYIDTVNRLIDDFICGNA